MKNLKILFLSFLVGFLFIACEGEDDSLSPATNYLLGTWELREIGSVNQSNGVLSYEAVIPDGTCGFDTFSFQENNVFIFTEYTSEIATSCDTYIDNGTFNAEFPSFLDITYSPEGATNATTLTTTIESLTLDTLILFTTIDEELVAMKFFKI